MRAAQWITCCWPGLSGLWLQGQWSGLGMATGFAALLNLALAAQFLWPQALPPSWLLPLWAAVLLAWCGGFCHAARLLSRLPARRPPQSEVDLFIQAQGEYLRGHWFEAEALLERLLRFDPEDVDAHLLLAGLYRHSRRYDAAAQRLRTLSQLDGAVKWRLEIEQEMALIERLADSETQPDSEIQPELASPDRSHGERKPSEERPKEDPSREQKSRSEGGSAGRPLPERGSQAGPPQQAGQTAPEQTEQTEQSEQSEQSEETGQTELSESDGRTALASGVEPQENSRTEAA